MDLAEFKALAQQAMVLVNEEPATLQYDWFFNSDETVCVVREAFVNSDAVLAHVANVGDLLRQLISLGGGLQIDAFGDPTPELVNATAALQPSFYGFFQGK